MTPFFFDTETHLIKNGCAAPKMVCMSTSSASGKTQLLTRDAGLRCIEAALKEPELLIVGHNVFYDLGVCCAESPDLFVPLVFKAFNTFRVRDTIVRQQLIDIASGNLKYRLDPESETYVKTGYTLADLSLRLCNRVLPKEDTWRLKYALLDGVPLADWPDEARKYAVDDAVATREVYLAQAEMAGNGGVIPTEERATRDAWALWLMGAWGIRTDGAAVEKLKKALEEEVSIATAKLMPTGIIRAVGSKNMKEISRRIVAGFTAKGLEAPKTPTGKVQSDHDALVDSGDADLLVLADAGKSMKLLSTYVPVLEGGTMFPINARFNVLVESNRTSCSGPNLQNPPRKGGVRDCFLPREGFVFCSNDFDTAELRSLAQACLDLIGTSCMAESLRKGIDLHLSLAADFMDITYLEASARYREGDNEIEEQRQLMKIANFGFPGGLSSDTFVDYAKGYGKIIDTGLSKRVYEQWHRSNPEMRTYFNLVANLVGRAGEGVVVSPRSGFVRGGLSFTQLSNHYFQSLTATGAKDALWNVTRECYTMPESPLWGCRPVVFMHDEIITEMPESRAAKASARQTTIMQETMQRWTPDVPAKTSSVLMRRWIKGAKPVYVDGQLVPSRPVVDGERTRWIADI